MASLWSSCFSVWLHFELQREWKAPCGWVMWSEARSHGGESYSDCTSSHCARAPCVWPASIAAVKLPLVDNASLLCWWLAAQALSSHTELWLPELAIFSWQEGKKRHWLSLVLFSWRHCLLPYIFQHQRAFDNCNDISIVSGSKLLFRSYHWEPV